MDYLSRHNRALTLIEMLVVIVLISLLAGLGGSVYTGSYKRLLVEKAARGLYITARYARVAAIAHQRPYHLLLDRENKKYWLVTMEQDVNSLDATEQIGAYEHPAFAWSCSQVCIAWHRHRVTRLFPAGQHHYRDFWTSFCLAHPGSSRE